MNSLIERKDRKGFRNGRKEVFPLRYFAIPSLRPLRLDSRAIEVQLEF